jgi:hypothetical protein
LIGLKTSQSYENTRHVSFSTKIGPFFVICVLRDSWIKPLSLSIDIIIIKLEYKFITAVYLVAIYTCTRGTLCTYCHLELQMQASNQLYILDQI